MLRPKMPPEAPDPNAASNSIRTDQYGSVRIRRGEEPLFHSSHPLYGSDSEASETAYVEPYTDPYTDPYLTSRSVWEASETASVVAARRGGQEAVVEHVLRDEDAEVPSIS